MENKPRTASEWAMQKIKEDGAGGILSVTFPGWAAGVFKSTLSAANVLGWSPAQVAVFALTQWLEGNGHLVFTPPAEASPLPAVTEDRLRSALRWAITGADATTKKDKDAAFDALLPILRAALDGTGQE